MKQIFAKYNFVPMADETDNDVIRLGIDLSRRYSENKGKNLNTDEQEKYNEANRVFTEALVKRCVESAQYQYTGLEQLKNPQITGSVLFREKFNAVIAQIMTPVAPAVVSQQFMDVSEVKQVGFGDTGRFIIKSNDLFYVNDIAEGVQLGAVQRLYNNEVVVNPTPKQIFFDVDWYLMAAGLIDMGDWAYRVGASYGGYINANIITALNANLTTGCAASSAYFPYGFSDRNFIKVAQLVSTANANAEVYCMGSLYTLGIVFPSTTGLQYGLGQEIAKQGFLDRYKGVRMVPIDPAMLPGTVNNASPVLVVPDGYLYMMGMGTYKPIKVVFEGQNVSVQTIPTETPDKTGGLAVTMRLGVSSILGSKIGGILGVA